MSVLYKALQKAEKENELRQSATSETGFDPQRLTASGALKSVAGRGRLFNRIAMGAIFLVAVGGGVAFVMYQDVLSPPAGRQVTSAPQASAAGKPAAESVLQAPASSTPAPAVEAPKAAESAVAASTESAPTAPAPAEVKPAEAKPTETRVAAAPPVAAKPAARPTPQTPEAMPDLPIDSPARMLSPPISIARSEFALAGVGNRVTVREVSKAARSNVAAGYDALIGGSYDTALGFYDEALKEEPKSILALLGRGAALQKLGRGQDAQDAYESVLKLDPENREALTNITAVAGERAPQAALAHLLELERQYPKFSPIKAQIGLTYAKLDSLPQALDYFRRAIALSPDTVMYHYNMALVLDHLGRRDQAISSYERVLASISGGRGPSELSSTEIERRVRFLRTH